MIEDYYPYEATGMAENLINKWLIRVYGWLIVNKLALDVDKTVYITFRTYRDNVPRSVNIKIKN